MLLLPVYLNILLGSNAANLVQPEPFVHAFVWLIMVPLALAVIVQLWASRTQSGAKVSAMLGLAPVPATALVLFIVVAAVVPQLGFAADATFGVIPVYLAFAVIAPLAGWLMGRMFRLEAAAGRAIAFSAGTRNSLVVLPLALAVPGAVPILPAIIVTQTLVELLSELIYVRVIARVGRQ
jgi:ACR3 family arsenite efflux pump ArsB